MNLIRAKLPETTFASIALTILVMNLDKIPNGIFSSILFSMKKG